MESTATCDRCIVVALVTALSTAQCGPARTPYKANASAASTVAPAAASGSSAPAPAEAALGSRSVALPGSPGLVRMDFIAYDRETHALWIPAGNTGRVDVLDVTTDTVRQIEGFAALDQIIDGHHHALGPSSIAIGDGVAYVGNRQDMKVCPVDTHALRIGECATLSAPPDALVIVSARHELWATLPRDNKIAVLQVDGLTRPTLLATVQLERKPEGAAVDLDRSVFYTNLEDADRTLAIEMATRRVVATWSPQCGEDGPRGLAIDTVHRRLFVACTDGVVALDTARDGAITGRVATGGGVDEIAYWPARNRVFVGVAETGVMRVLSVDEHGAMHVIANAPTADGARNPVVDENGHAYLSESQAGRIYITDPPP